MPHVLVLTILLASCHSAVAADAKPNTLTPTEIAAGWILLFDGETTFGWKAASQADWSVANGVISVSSGEPGLLHTTSEFGDYELQVDFKAPQSTNSGVFLRTPIAPKAPAQDCYELNIADASVSPFSTGGFVERKKTEATPTVDAWHTFTVTAKGGHFIVKLDDKEVLDYTDEKPIPRGYIGLQLNKGKCEFRNVKLKPLSQTQLLNGKDLTGWKISTDVKQKSQVTINKEGVLQIKNGPGQLESDGKYADFTLQLDVFSNGKALNSGIFFRSIPGDWQNGYECQIQNGYKDDDRTKPADGGTGGIYRRQPARRIVANDFEWFTMTICTSGPHMAAWVNGYQVSDWTDTRPPHDNPRNGLRLAAGTLILQGHDPTTDLSFRNFRVAELPAGP